MLAAASKSRAVWAKTRQASGEEKREARREAERGGRKNTRSLHIVAKLYRSRVRSLFAALLLYHHHWRTLLCGCCLLRYHSVRRGVITCSAEFRDDKLKRDTRINVVLIIYTRASGKKFLDPRPTNPPPYPPPQKSLFSFFFPLKLDMYFPGL